MAWDMFRSSRTARRVAVVDGFTFPAGVRHRLREQHADLGDAQVGEVEQAARQWFRLIARHPAARLSMPSVVVDDLWRELVRHAREYEALCRDAFGHVPEQGPRPGGGASDGTGDRSRALLATLDVARRDERCGPTELPLLFAVDRMLNVRDGRRYLADCGGRGDCYGVAGMICLQHLLGLDEQPRHWRRGPLTVAQHRQHENAALYGGAAAAAGHFGGGGDGGGGGGGNGGGGGGQ